MRGGGAALLSLLIVLAGCSAEKRVVDADQPITDPLGPFDPRTSAFQDNVYQVAQGGRYFAWYGCNGCHGTGAKGVLDLSDARHNDATPDRIYWAIAHHGTLGARILPEQRWQLAAYVQKLPTYNNPYRRRQDVDQVGEAQANDWSGPVQ